MATVSASEVDFEKIDFDSLTNMKNYISKGSYGAIYGPFTRNSKEFAVKQILIGQDRPDDFKIKLESKKTIWTSLKHDHLIEIHYVSLKPKVVFIVMEYASGGSLRQLLDNSDVKDHREIYVLNWAKQIAEGMLYLHEKDIVHRDLKSTNNSREQILVIKQEHEQERKAWSEEKEQLMKQIQELSADLRCKSDPVLIKTIRTKAANEKQKAIRGLTILDKEMFVVSWESSEVDVYDSMTFGFRRQWNLQKLIHPVDLSSCSRNKCLYIFDHKGSDQSKEILRTDPNGNLLKYWSTGDDYGHGLSVTDEANVLLPVYNKNRLIEYSPDGQLIRQIKLSSDAGICHPRHAIKLTNGHFLLSHGYDGDDLHRVCVVDVDGLLQKSFGEKLGSAMGQMNHPMYLAVDGNGFAMVADRGNQRVLLLDSDLKFKREILSKERHGLKRVWSILLEGSNGLLYVTDNEFDSTKKKFRDGRIFIFK